MEDGDQNEQNIKRNVEEIETIKERTTVKQTNPSLSYREVKQENGLLNKKERWNKMFS